MQKKRYFSVDVLRAIAILLMIQIHFVENLSRRAASSSILYDISKFLGLLSAPTFTFLAGLSIWLWLKDKSLSSAKVLRRQAIRRGLLLFGIALAFVSLGSQLLFFSTEFILMILAPLLFLMTVAYVMGFMKELK